MRIQGYWKILKKKYEFLTVILILTLSFTLLSTLSTINSTYRTHLFTKIMDESATDCQISINSGLDPTDLFDKYLQTYDGFLSVEKKYKSHVFSVANAIVSLNYYNSTNSISKQWEFPNSYTDIFFVGIDESTFNALTEKTENPITNINLTYQQIQSGFLSANFLNEFEYLFSQLKMEITTDATNFLDYDLPVRVDFFNGLAKNSIDFLSIKKTIENSSLQLMSSFQIYNEEFFYSLIGLNEWKLEAPVFLCGEELMSQFLSKEKDATYHFSDKILLNIKFDRNPILKSSPLKMRREMDNFRMPIFEKGGEFNSLNIDWTKWSVKLSDLLGDNERFQFYSALLFIPIFILCGKYVSSSFKYIIEKRKYEFGLYLINGMEYKFLKRSLLLLGFFLGVISGIFGAISGFFLARLVGNILFQKSIAFTQFILLQSWSIILQNGIINLIMGGLFALFSMKNLIKRLNTNELNENLINNQAIIKNDEKRSKWRIFLFLFFFASLVFSYYYDAMFDTVDFNVLADDYRPIFQTFRILGPSMVLFPFVFPLVIISLISERLGDWVLSINSKRIEKKTKERLTKTKIGKIDDGKEDKRQGSSFKRLLVWNLVQKLSKNRTHLELYSLAIIFLTISINLGYSYQYSENLHASFYYANGEIMNLRFFNDISIKDIDDLTDQIQQNAANSKFNHINTICHTQENRDRYSQEDIDWETKMNSVKVSDMLYYCFSWTNYTKMNQDTSMQENWMIGGSIDELMTEMEKPNSILIPRYLMDVGVKINDTLNFTFKSINGTNITSEGIVKGAYNKFPASYIGRNKDIFMSIDLIQDARIQRADVIFYPISDDIPIQKSLIKRDIANNFDSDFSFQFLDLSQYKDEFDAKFFEIIQFEGFLLMIFAFAGFLIFSMNSSLQIKKEIAILRTKGLREEDFLKSALIESGIIALMGSLFSLISIIGVKGLLLYLNLRRTGSGDDQFFIYYQTNWLIYLLCFFLGGILFFSINFAYNLMQIRDTRVDHKLEDLMRAPD
ncbi:FtsX-like permease family protein [Candidatus Lokiarchaeum ossiferum]|uniref:FtsX-like permease family protein n=1 Tax=Candidatus Lokiarchaeum ossiferum TaxID=2951803 RepID=UPI00352D690E